MRILRTQWLRSMATRKMSGEELYKKIDTFVFFDLETTDLIRGSRMPRITELSMVAAARDSIRLDRRNKLALPRVLHKLTVPICPMQQINQIASYTTNLWNDALDNVKPFDDDTYNIIMQFINRLPGLVCFVAHNGNRFDYPVFLSELDRINKTFPNNILSVDTLQAFHEFFSDSKPIDQKPVPVVPEGIDEVDEEELAFLRSQKSNTSLDDNWDNALCSVLDDFEKVKTRDSRVLSWDLDNGADVLDAITNKGQNEACSSSSSSTKTSPVSMQAINEKTPENQIMRNLDNTRKNILDGARKKLDFGDKNPKNFKLSTIYMHMIGCEPENSHCAEGDCISMLRCVCQMGPHFAEWADYNAESLIRFKKT